MATDTRTFDASTQPSVGASTEALGQVAQEELAVALSAIDVGSEQYWRSLILERVRLHYRAYFPEPREKAEATKKSHLETLLSRPIAVLSFIWLRSGFLIGHPFQEITRADVGRYLEGQGGAEEYTKTYEVRGARVVSAMLTYGLVEELPARGRSLPLRGTRLLHVLMFAYHTNQGLEWANIFANEKEA